MIQFCEKFIQRNLAKSFFQKYQRSICDISDNFVSVISHRVRKASCSAYIEIIKIKLRMLHLQANIKIGDSVD